MIITIINNIIETWLWTLVDFMFRLVPREDWEKRTCKSYFMIKISKKVSELVKEINGLNLK